MRFASADAYPSSVADFVRATFSHKGRRNGVRADELEEVASFRSCVETADD